MTPTRRPLAGAARFACLQGPADARPAALRLAPQTANRPGVAGPVSRRPVQSLRLLAIPMPALRLTTASSSDRSIIKDSSVPMPRRLALKGGAPAWLVLMAALVPREACR